MDFLDKETISERHRNDIEIKKNGIKKQIRIPILKLENFGKNRTDLLQELQNWYKKVEDSEVVEIENFKSLVERNQGVILNYFIKGETNAIAECINSKIQRFIAINQGTRDREFFYFRLANFFSG